MTDLARPLASAPITERLERACVTLTRPIAFVGVLGMLIAAGVTVVDVLMRWLASTAITALNEITAMAFAVAVAACMPAGLAGGVNLRIDLLSRWITGRVAAWSWSSDHLPAVLTRRRSRLRLWSTLVRRKSSGAAA